MIDILVLELYSQTDWPRRYPEQARPLPGYAPACAHPAPMPLRSRRVQASPAQGRSQWLWFRAFKMAARAACSVVIEMAARAACSGVIELSAGVRVWGHLRRRRCQTHIREHIYS